MRLSPLTTLLVAALVLTRGVSAAQPGMACTPGSCGAGDECGPVYGAQCGEGDECAAPGGVFGGMCGCDPCGPRWSFAAEGMALQRSTARQQTLLIPLDSLGVDPVDAQQLDFPVAYGYRLSAIRHDVLGCDVELAYFQLDGFEARSNIPGPTYMVTGRDAGEYVDDGEVRYKSALYNAELNLRHHATDWLTVLAGIRIVEIDERFSIGGELYLVPNFQTEINTFNHLYGFQLGADAEVYNMGGPLRINAICKAGVYDNLAFQNYGVYDVSFGSQRDQTAFLGEAGLVATYAVTERLAFRASATAMWITGVALAPEQIGGVDLQTASSTIDTFGTLFYYGGGLGLEYRF